MDSKHFNAPWNLLNLYNFNIDQETVYELQCIICKGILKNAFTSLCNCKYCFCCFEQYLSGGEKLCPGQADNSCNKDITQILKYLRTDEDSNRRVSEIIVKCPFESCSIKNKLIHMEFHIETHKTKQPFLDISNIDRSDKEASSFVKTIEQLHIEILRFRNDFANQETLIGEMSKEIKQLRINCDEKGFNLQHLAENNNKYISIENLKNFITNLIVKRKMGIDRLSIEDDDFKRINDQLINDMQNVLDEIQIIDENSMTTPESIDTIKCDFGCLRNLYDRKTAEIVEKEINKISAFPKNVEIKQEKCSPDHCSTSNADKHLSNIDDSVSDSDDQSNTDQSLSTKMITHHFRKRNIEWNENAFNKKIKLSQSIDHHDDESPITFLWQISQLSRKIFHAKYNSSDNMIFSESFYSHGNRYKMCLVLYPNGFGNGKDSHLSVGISILRGRNDDKLTWPMNRSICIALTDATDDTVKQTIVFHYDTIDIENRHCFDKPCTYSNRDCSIYRFFHHRSLVDCKSFSQHDTIILRCSVD